MSAEAKRPAGRKSLQGAGQSPVMQVRVTQAQKDKVVRLGGSAWVRSVIDKAKEQKPQELSGIVKLSTQEKKNG